MAFRRRFQTGTLERSIRQFGRFRRPMRSFKRKQFGHFYSDADLQPEIIENPEPVYLTLIDNLDLAPSAAFPSQTPVRGLSFDIYLGLTMVPDFNASLTAFNALTWQWGFYKKDTDEANLDLDTSFATHTMIRWGCWESLATAANGSGAAAANPSLYHSARIRFRVSELKTDENITFVLQRDNFAALTSQLDAIFLAVRMRVRYEIP